MKEKIGNHILELVNELGLKEKAMANIDSVIDAYIESDHEIGLDTLEGNLKEDLFYRFDDYSFKVDEYGSSQIVTTIRIYSTKLVGPNIDIAVGSYREYTDLNGQHIDEFLDFDWTYLRYDVDYYMALLNTKIDALYKQPGPKTLELTKAISHVMMLVKGRHYEMTIPLILECTDLLKAAEVGKTEYKKVYLEFVRDFSWYLKNKGIINSVDELQ